MGADIQPAVKRAGYAAVCLVAALVVGVGAASGHRISLVATVVVAVGFLCASLVVTADDPRRIALISIAALLSLSVATGLRAVGPVALSAFIPTAVLMVTALPGVCSVRHRRAPEMWGLTISVILSITAVCATAAGHGSWVAVIEFLVTTLPAILAMWRINPDLDEILVLAMGILTGVVVSTTLGIVALRAPSGRALGVTHHSNQYAMQIALIFPILFLLWARGRVRTQIALAITFVLIIGALESGSRSGTIALVIVLAILGSRMVRASSFAVAAIGAGTALLLFGLPTAATPTLARLTESDLTKNSDDARLHLADKGIAKVQESPVFGSGIPKTQLPHNVILLVWGGMGIIGLVVFFVLVWRILAGALGRPRGLERWALSLSVLGFLITVSLNNSIGTPIAWFVLGLLQAGVIRAQRERSSDSAQPTITAGHGLSGLVTAAT